MSGSSIYFLHYITKGTILGNNISLYKKSILIFIQLLFEKIHSKRNSTRYYHKCQILITLEFSWQVLKKFSIIVTKILPVGAKWFHANRRTDGRTDGQTGRDVGRQADRYVNLTVLFHSYSNAPTNTSLRQRNFSLQRQGKTTCKAK
jgi:hypothetical protein